MLWEFVLMLCQSLWNRGVSVNLATAVPKPFCVYPARARATPGGGMGWGEWEKERRKNGFGWTIDVLYLSQHDSGTTNKYPRT